ncbi:hypothetical protein EIP91_005513 [Steccherinum ochraceum]|uniref:F-box domain-containing protein n=1 Tax=Steccherinum ochraceum TaxID=92696 RepID=A0A4V2MXW4_9APHY|nr:hypothetical protein EIP91_005513 [Steccherinum ochraceum]
MPRLRSADVFTYRISWAHPIFQPSLVSLCLHLIDSFEESSSAALSILNGMPRLERLVIEGSFPASDTSAPATDHVILPRLKLLQLDTGFRDWLRLDRQLDIPPNAVASAAIVDYDRQDEAYALISAAIVAKLEKLAARSKMHVRGLALVTSRTSFCDYELHFIMESPTVTGFVNGDVQPHFRIGLGDNRLGNLDLVGLIPLLPLDNVTILFLQDLFNGRRELQQYLATIQPPDVLQNITTLLYSTTYGLDPTKPSPYKAYLIHALTHRTQTGLPLKHLVLSRCIRLCGQDVDLMRETMDKLGCQLEWDGVELARVERGHLFSDTEMDMSGEERDEAFVLDS